MKKLLLGIMVLSSLIYGELLKVGDTISSFSVSDQFDKIHVVNSKDYKIILVANEKDVAGFLNDYLAVQDRDFLAKNKTAFISNISQMPSFVTKLFALPKMREYKYPLFLIYEENKRFTFEDESLTVIKTDNDKIISIEYIKAKEENENAITKIFK